MLGLGVDTAGIESFRANGDIVAVAGLGREILVLAGRATEIPGRGTEGVAGFKAGEAAGGAGGELAGACALGNEAVLDCPGAGEAEGAFGGTDPDCGG